jgi:peptidoglycan/xylan/chitin deacetylase (PgdA/CDA1 family)
MFSFRNDRDYMPARLLKLFLACAVYGALQIARAIQKVTGSSRNAASATVLFYHHVFDEERDRFARQMDHLLAWAEPIRADHVDATGSGRPRVAITADDGWLSFARNGVPVLAARSIPATIFLITGRLGQHVEQDRYEHADRLLSREEIAQLLPPLVTLGSHTVSHPHLADIPPEQALSELTESRRFLEALPNANPDLFCFPYGQYSDDLLQLCRRAGYRRAFTTQPGLTFVQEDEFQVGRVEVNPTDWLLEFHLKITGVYRWLPWALARTSHRRGNDSRRHAGAPSVEPSGQALAAESKPHGATAP